MLLLGTKVLPSFNSSQPAQHSNTALDAPIRGRFTEPALSGAEGGLLRTYPGMFIGHSEIVAFLLHRFDADNLHRYHGS